MRLETPAEVRRWCHVDETGYWPLIWFNGRLARFIGGIDVGVEHTAKSHWKVDAGKLRCLSVTYSVKL